MAELVIESEGLKTSWLQQELIQSRDLQHQPIKRQPTVRNLSSAGRGTVRGFPATASQHQNGQEAVIMATHMPRRSSSAEGECSSFPQIAMKGIYNSSKLQELPAGYFSNGDLWLSGSKGDMVRSHSAVDVTSSPFQDKSRGTVSASMNNMSNAGFPSRMPNGVHSQLRSRSAKQRSLGMSRGDYNSVIASESQILDLNGWRCISPEYFQNQSPLLVKVNNYQDNNKRPQRYHYYGQTRINLDDPTGLFQQFDQKNSGNVSKQNVHQSSSRNSNPTENLVLVRTARRHSATGQKNGRTIANSKKGKIPSPPNSPFLPPELFLRLHHNSRSIVESTDMLQRFKDSMLHQNSHSSANTSAGHMTESSDEKAHNVGYRSSKEDYVQDPYENQVLDNFSKSQYTQKQLAEYPHKSQTSNGETHTTTSDNMQDPYIVDEAERLSESFVTKATTNERQKKKDQLSFSDFFLVDIDHANTKHDRVAKPVSLGKAGPNRRSVRFKVQDTIHEYEPWSPIQAH